MQTSDRTLLDGASKFGMVPHQLESPDSAAYASPSVRPPSPVPGCARTHVIVSCLASSSCMCSHVVNSR